MPTAERHRYHSLLVDVGAAQHRRLGGRTLCTSVRRVRVRAGLSRLTAPLWANTPTPAPHVDHQAPSIVHKLSYLSKTSDENVRGATGVDRQGADGAER
jgi:hypothetical protein